MIETVTAEDIKRFLKLNKHSLDFHAETFADEHNTIGEHVRMALADVEKAKRNVELVESEIFLDIQNNPEKYDLNKSPAVEATKKMVSLDKRYREAYNIYLEAIDLKNKWQSIKDSHAMKKSMIQAEVSLFNAEYYTIDTSKREKIVKEFVDGSNKQEHEKETKNVLSESMKRRDRRSRNLMEEGED